MKKLVTMLAVVLLAACAFAQNSAAASIEEAVISMPDDAEIALYSHADMDLVGYSSDFSRTAFNMFIVEGFAGPATMVIEQRDGTVQTFEVEVLDGSVLLNGTSFLDVLVEAGFENAEVVTTAPMLPDAAADAPALPEGAIDSGSGNDE